MAGEAEFFGLVRSDKQVDHLHGDGLSFSILLEGSGGGEYVDILEYVVVRVSKPPVPPGGVPEMSTSRQVPLIGAVCPPALHFSTNAVSRSERGPAQKHCYILLWDVGLQSAGSRGVLECSEGSSYRRGGAQVPSLNWEGAIP